MDGLLEDIRKTKIINWWIVARKRVTQEEDHKGRLDPTWVSEPDMMKIYKNNAKAKKFRNVSCVYL